MSEAQEANSRHEGGRSCVSNKYPELKLLFHIPTDRTSRKQAGLFKAMGIEVGSSLTFIPACRRTMLSRVVYRDENK